MHGSREANNLKAKMSFFLGPMKIYVTQNVAEYPPHHVTHGPGKFEVATSNS